MKYDQLYSKLTEDYGYDEDFSKEDWQTDKFYEDGIDGSLFDNPGKYYTVGIKGSADVIEDEDYRGRIKYPNFDTLEIDDFMIEETDETGEVIRDQDQIKKESRELFDKILDYAKTRLQEEWEG